MELSEVTKRMILVICAASLVFIAASAAYYRSFAFLPFAVGVILCSSLNVLKVVMIERSAEKALNLESKQAGNFISIQYLLRFLLTAIVLIAAAKLPFISLWGAVAGIFTLQIAALSMKYFFDKMD